jgi:transcriptional regulator GlxA family with amidase domain
MGNRKEIRVSLVLIPDVTASTLLSIYDIFTLLPRLVPGEAPYSVTIVGESTAPVSTSCAISLQAQASFADVPVTDIVIVPSLMLRTPLWPVGKYQELVAWLKRQYAQGAVLCSACSGVFPLLETGLFDEVPVTCHWYYEPALRKSFPKARIEIEKTLIIAGQEQRLVMSGASASWHDLVLYLITRFSGPAAASASARFFLLNWHPEGQAPYARFMEDTSHDDATIIKAQAWIRQHWMQTNPIDELVRSTGLPERSFKRRFKNATGLTPMDYIQHTRIEQARQLLESSTRPVDAIAADIGYEDPAFFRKLFKRLTNMTPSAYRLKFRTPYAK